MTGLSSAIFELHMPDVLALKAQLLSDGKTQEEIDLLPLAYFKKKCASDFYLCTNQLLFAAIGLLFAYCYVCYDYCHVYRSQA